MMRKLVIAVFVSLAGIVAAPASAQVTFGFSSGGVHLGISIPVYPRLVHFDAQCMFQLCPARNGGGPDVFGPFTFCEIEQAASTR